MKQYHLVKYIFDGVCHGTVPWQADVSEWLQILVLALGIIHPKDTKKESGILLKMVKSQQLMEIIMEMINLE